ncbi:MAG: TIGR00341 family protein [Candidatus Thorarchaeota archaeon]
MRQFQITLPEEKVGQVMEFLEEKCQVRNIAKIHTAPGFMLIFRISPGKSQDILKDLEAIGVGVHYGIIDVLPIEATKPMEAEVETIKPTERLSVEEIYGKIAAGTRLSFDFIALLVVSCIIAAIGLATNSPVFIVASMLLAPLMGPILGLSLGAIIKDRRLIITGIKNEVYGLLIAFIMGMIMGAILLPYSPLLFPILPGWPTPEMTSRGLVIGVIVGIVVAAASGAGVALAVTRGEISSLVGVAIAASLMPPAVNAGMNLIYALLGPFYFGGAVNVVLHFGIAGVSFTLVLVNIVFINIVAMLVFILKRVAPIKGKSIFWHDLPNLEKKRRDELWHR